MTLFSMPYGPKPGATLVGLLFSATLAIGGVWIIATPGAIAQSRIAHAFGVPMATALFGIGMLASAAIALAAAYLMVRSLMRARRIELTESHLLFPHGLFATTTSRIPLGTIAAVEVQPLGTKRALRIRTSAATLLVVEAMCPSPMEFDQLGALLRAHAPRRT